MRSLQNNKSIALVMTDKRNLVFPKNKNAKCWDYDISHKKVITNGINITTPIGGKKINITLIENYSSCSITSLNLLK